MADKEARVPQESREPLLGTAEDARDKADKERARVSHLVLLQLLGACLAWLACSSGIILVNRVIIRELGFGFPMALSAMGQGVSCLAAWLLCDVFKLVSQSSSVTHRFFFTNIAPIGIAQGLGLWLTNKAYQLLTVAFIEMSRALMPLAIMLALWLARVETPTWEHVQAVCVTAVGCAVSAYGEVALNTLGLICVSLIFVTEALRMVLSQFLMQGRDISPWQNVKLMTWPAFVSLTAMTVALEWGSLRSKRADLIVAANPVTFLMASFLGIAVNFLCMVIIKLSSATTYKLLAAIRGPLVVLSGMLLFSEVVTPPQLLGYSLALVGFVWYNMAKAREQAQAAALRKIAQSSGPLAADKDASRA